MDEKGGLPPAGQVKSQQVRDRDPRPHPRLLVLEPQAGLERPRLTSLDS